MCRVVPIAFLALSAGMHGAFAGGPIDDAAVVKQLASADPAVRQAALMEVGLRDEADAEKVLGHAGADPVSAASVARVRGARTLTKRLAGAPRDSVAFWRLLEAAHGAEWRDLEPAIVLEATH